MRISHVGRLAALLVGVAACCPWATAAPKFPKDELRDITPAGYKIDAALILPGTDGGVRRYLFALSDVTADAADSAEIPRRVPMLLLAKSESKLVALDRVQLHPLGFDEAHTRDVPNYFEAMSAENVGAGKLYLVRSMEFGGGSGSGHFFDFYRVRDGKLQLLQSFLHGRMERSYFALYRNAIYDGKLRCERGAKHGRAYTYTCRIDVTKYVYDGDTVRDMGTQPLRVRQGNRFLSDTYWFVSVRKALRNKEIFSTEPRA